MRRLEKRHVAQRPRGLGGAQATMALPCARARAPAILAGAGESRTARPIVGTHAVGAARNILRHCCCCCCSRLMVLVLLLCFFSDSSRGDERWAPLARRRGRGSSGRI